MVYASRKIKPLGVIPYLTVGQVILAHGCFDLLHLGHLAHLEQARSLGDTLVVTITPDEFVNKGPGRPWFTTLQRAQMVAGLACVDWVAINTGRTATPAIEIIRPSIYIKGIDWWGKLAHDEEAAVKACGGEIYYTDTPKFSSTEIGRRILSV